MSYVLVMGQGIKGLRSKIDNLLSCGRLDCQVVEWDLGILAAVEELNGANFGADNVGAVSRLPCHSPGRVQRFDQGLGPLCCACPSMETATSDPAQRPACPYSPMSQR
jgi:hypothetical protein